MDAETWRRVNAVFHRALEAASAEREALVRRECSGDSALFEEVLSLLGAHERTDQFLAEPASAPDRAAAASAPVTQRVGQQIGQYRIERVLGRGGMGVVYLADDLRLGLEVALKAIAPTVTADPARRERLRREARAAAALTHPGIATVYALEEFGDEIFIAGEFVAGETLREEVAHGPAPASRALESAIEIAHALAAAHDRGVVHRDLKPDNIIRTPSGSLKILDFGLARMRDAPPELAHLTDDGKVFGTPGYMSPEQIRRGHVDARSDLFSLGILLCELLNGSHPFGGGDSATTIARILEDEPAMPPVAAAGSRETDRVRPGLVAVIRILLRKDPAARYPSAHALLVALERVRTGDAAPETHPSPVWTDAQRWWRFHQIGTSAYYAALLMPTWWARHELGTARGLPIFLTALVAAIAAITIRMHLWFAAASMPDEWAHQHARNWLWLRIADVGFVGAVAAAGFGAIWIGYTFLGVALVSASVLALLFATIIEPATTRAAFGQGRRNGSEA